MHLIVKLWQSAKHISRSYLFVCLLALFSGSWFVMWLCEEPGAKIVQPAVYWWYFLVTIGTVGYGDFAPATLGGRIAGAFLIIGGIGLMTAVFGKLMEAISSRAENRKKGKLKVNLKNHIVIFGYRRGETERLVAEIRGDATDKHDIVICSASIAENPFKSEDGVRFVSGDPVSDEVINKADVRFAEAVIIHGHDDAQTLSISIAVSEFVSEGASIVAFFADESYAKNAKRVNPRVRCVPNVSTQLMVQAMQDPGSETAIEVLVSNLDNDATQYCLELPDDFETLDFDTLLFAMKREFKVTAIGVAESRDSRPDMNPNGDVLVKPGMILLYIGNERLVNPEWRRLRHYVRQLAFVTEEV